MVKYKDKLIVNPKLEIRKSDIHSYGVFATENISVGDKLEECWYLISLKIRKLLMLKFF